MPDWKQCKLPCAVICTLICAAIGGAVGRESFAGEAPMFHDRPTRASNRHAPKGPPRRANIVVIICDQLAQKGVGAYGNPHASTPTIDQLARSGVRFANAYVTCPLCQPSRASLWTGLYPHQTGILSNGKHEWRTPVERIETLGKLFSRAGYTAVHFGKTHDAGSLRGFDVKKNTREDNRRFWGKLKTEPAWPIHGDTYGDRSTTLKVLDWLQHAPNGPFLLVVSLNNPHDICKWVGTNRGPHQDTPVASLPPLPKNFEITDLSKRPLPIQYLCCSHFRMAQAAVWNRSNYRHYLAAYYHYVSRVDSEMALILQALRSRGAMSDTLIVVLADHGDGMAAHRMVTKAVSLYEETTRIPLIFSGPGVAGGDRLIEQPLVSTVDLLPTLCDYAGIATPSGLPGRSLMPWIRGETPKQDRAYVVCQWYASYAGKLTTPGRMLRTSRYKYIHYLEGNGEELYDLEADPGETRTLVDDPDYATVLATHRRLLDEYLQETGDPYRGEKVVVAPRWRSHRVGYQFHVDGSGDVESSESTGSR